MRIADQVLQMFGNFGGRGCREIPLPSAWGEDHIVWQLCLVGPLTTHKERFDHGERSAKRPDEVPVDRLRQSGRRRFVLRR